MTFWIISGRFCRYGKRSVILAKMSATLSLLRTRIVCAQCGTPGGRFAKRRLSRKIPPKLRHRPRYKWWSLGVSLPQFCEAVNCVVGSRGSSGSQGCGHRRCYLSISFPHIMEYIYRRRPKALFLDEPNAYQSSVLVEPRPVLSDLCIDVTEFTDPVFAFPWLQPGFECSRPVS